MINNTNAQYVAAVAAVQALGATTVQINAPTAANTGDILTPEFKRDLNAYLGRLPASAPMKSLADIIAYNTAHPDDALKYGQTQLTASQATDLTDPAQNAAYVTARDNGAQLGRDDNAIDTALTTNNLEAILTPSGTLTASAPAPATRRSSSPPGTPPPPATRSGSRSTARPSARPSCSRSPTPTSRRRSCASRRARSTRACGAACPATPTRSRRARARRTRPPTRMPSRRPSPARCRRRSRSRSARRRRSRRSPGCRADLHRVDHRERHLHRGRGDADARANPAT